MSRRLARETAMKCCFAREYNVEADSASIINLENDEEHELTQEDIEYADAVLHGVAVNAEYLDDEIRKLAIGWDFGRMPRVDICIMRIALYELLFRDDIPESVSINEAVEIAKKYGGDKSAPYINGMLGTFSRQRMEGEREQ